MRGPSSRLPFRPAPLRCVSTWNSLSSIRAQWPSSWTSLAAVARTRDLHVSQSEYGQAAATLIGALGSVDAVRWLTQRPLIALLYRLAERSGMSWQKSQLNSLRARLAEEGRATAVVDEAEAALSAPEHVVTPAGEGRALGFEEFRKALSSEHSSSALGYLGRTAPPTGPGREHHVPALRSLVVAADGVDAAARGLPRLRPLAGHALRSPARAVRLPDRRTAAARAGDRQSRPRAHPALVYPAVRRAQAGWSGPIPGVDFILATAKTERSARPTCC